MWNINASETVVWNSTIGPSQSYASFILIWKNASSSLGMTLSSPNGIKFDSSAKPPINYSTNGTMIYYIVPDPEPGNWITFITGRSVPENGENYCSLIRLSSAEDLGETQPLDELSSSNQSS